MVFTIRCLWMNRFRLDLSTLDASMDHQMNLFSMEHENRYGEVMSDLIDIFIPPENASPEELEEAKRNMEKYADYRTYLSFDMEQIVEGEEADHRARQDDQEKFGRGRAESPLCSPFGELCPGLPDQSVAKVKEKPYDPAGCP